MNNALPLLFVPLLFAFAPSLASADEIVVQAQDGPDTPDKLKADDDATRHQIDRTWLYTDDAHVAAPWTLITASNFSYTNVPNSPSRVAAPIPNCTGACNTYDTLGQNTGLPGAMLGLGAELGILPRVSLMGIAQIGLGGPDSVPTPSVGGMAGVRVQVLPSSYEHLHIVVSGGYLREGWQGPIYDDDNNTWKPGNPNGDNGAWVQGAISGDIGRVRMAGTLHTEHIFADGRDPLDVMVEAGATYELVRHLRAGVEYVGQDLEETFTPGAEGGPRHFIGPIASLQLFGDRLSMVAGPSIGLTARSPDFIGRAAASYSF
jgi:hypothetical protein